MLINKLFPITCIFCGTNTEQALALCEGCEIDLPWITHCCKQCALPLHINETANLLCAQCQQHPQPFERTFALFHYQHPISRLITQLKFHQKLLYATWFGLLLAKYLRDAYQHDASYPDTVIPMPLHSKRLRERGYNQALEISRPIAKELDVPVNFTLCKRIRSTKMQSSQTTAKSRENNVKNAFVAEAMTFNHVLIIDDVITTGYTVRELSKVISNQGIRVDVACCARTDLV